MSLRRWTIAATFTVFAMYGLLIAALFTYFDWPELKRALLSPRIQYSIRLSLLTATAAAFFACVIAVPAAYALSRYRFRGRTLVDTFLELPVVVSPVALGAMLLILFSSRPGRVVQDHLIDVVYAIPGIVLAQFFAVAGMATRLVKAALDEIPVRYEAVARSLGAGPWKVFRTVTLPLAGRGILAAFILSWAKAVGEFGATITLAGTMAYKTETMTVAIYLALSAADVPYAVVLILLLILFSLATLFGVRVLLRRMSPC